MTRRLPGQSFVESVPQIAEPISPQGASSDPNAESPSNQEKVQNSVDRLPEQEGSSTNFASSQASTSAQINTSKSQSSTNPFLRGGPLRKPSASDVYGDLSVTNPWTEEIIPSSQVPNNADLPTGQVDPSGVVTPPSPSSDLEGERPSAWESELEGIARGEGQSISDVPTPQPPVKSHEAPDLLDLMGSREPTNVEIPMPEIPEPGQEALQGNAPEKPREPAASEVSVPNASEGLPAKPLTNKPGSETYQIRHVNWYDFSAPRNPRRSPIMVQNANGPCPLLALVNALVLSTPYGLDTALIETLRVREQVSLGLLLDAVIDELLSDRRASGMKELPDVTELYAFLLNLHTGMNVNPSFVRNISRGGRYQSGQPGGFEETKEMRLYGTFAVPVVHGWLLPTNDPAYSVLARSAKTFDEAQTLPFLEQELEEKLRASGLNEEEMQKLQDIASIKHFLSTTATQLTEHGLNVLRESLPGGSVAILFRNDHFSTVYKNPRNGDLLTLITDMGYATRDEIVWQSLVDVNGEGSSYLSGDFLPVGESHDTRQASGFQGDTSGFQGDDADWTTVGPSRRKEARIFEPRDQSNAQNSSEPPELLSLSIQDRKANSDPNVEEDYDRDLALALSMQMDEEDRQAREEQRRRQETLSRDYLDKQQVGRKRGFEPSGRPTIPPRNHNNSQNTTNRGLPRGGGTRTVAVRGARSSEDGVENPPPSYEQAASGPAYHPPPEFAAHPAPTSPPTRSSRPTVNARQSSAYVSDASVRSPHPSNVFVPPASLSGAPNRSNALTNGRNAQRTWVDGEERKEKDCIIM